jgi:hypothetical protein
MKELVYILKREEIDKLKMRLELKKMGVQDIQENYLLY